MNQMTLKPERRWHWELKKVKQRGLPFKLLKYVKVYDDEGERDAAK